MCVCGWARMLILRDIAHTLRVSVCVWLGTTADFTRHCAYLVCECVCGWARTKYHLASHINTPHETQRARPIITTAPSQSYVGENCYLSYISFLNRLQKASDLESQYKNIWGERDRIMSFQGKEDIEPTKVALSLTKYRARV